MNAMPESFKATYEHAETERTETLRISHEKAAEYINQELERRHSNKPYHGPEHTNGSPEGVVTGIELFSGYLKDIFAESLELGTADGAEQFELVAKGMTAGARAHDVVIEINGITEQGQVIRRRGWVEGGNERESFLLYRHKFIEVYTGSEALSPEEVETKHFELLVEDSLYGRYITSVEQTIAGTDPDAISMPMVPDEILASLPPDVVTNLVSRDGFPVYLRLDSKKTTLSLEALLASTADLMAAAYPDRFFATGNGEFWELHASIAEDCVSFLANPESLTRERASAILGAMQGWRKVQIGVALGQQIRLQENFTEEHITELFEKSFQCVPHQVEVASFVAAVRQHEAGMRESVILSNQKLEEFKHRFTLEGDATGALSLEEQELFQSALTFMGGMDCNLPAYCAEVRQAIAQQS